MAKRRKSSDMMGIMQTGIMWGVGSSVISSVTPTSGVGKTAGDFAQVGLGVIAIRDISKKIKYK
jgi:hypothetical protein